MKVDKQIDENGLFSVFLIYCSKISVVKDFNILISKIF